MACLISDTEPTKFNISPREERFIRFMFTPLSVQFRNLIAVIREVKNELR